MSPVRKVLIIVSIGPLLATILPLLAAAQDAVKQTVFRVKYLAQGVVYIDGGQAAGLQPGQKLMVVRPDASGNGGTAGPGQEPVIASLKVIAVAASSAVCEILSFTQPVQVGDLAHIAPDVVEQMKEEKRQERLVGGREYPQLVTFTTGDPVSDEARALIPRPPTPDVNRMQGRIGFEYSSVVSYGNPSTTSSEIGIVARMNMTRIGGTYWNFDGFYRGLFTTLSGAAAPVTVNDLINRTYTLNLEYDNPNSAWVAGGGRLYLPWATSLDVIDGAYAGHRLGSKTTVGFFGGSTPDPTSYDYNPNGKIGGMFVNFHGGSYDNWRYSATFGVAVNTIGWHAVRQYGFVDTTISFQHNLSLYDATEIDAPHVAVVMLPGATGPSAPTTTTSTGGLNRSYISLRYEPAHFLELDLNDTYYRDFPTFDPLLIATGLLDQYLFQGLSGGARFNLPSKISLYTEVGQSSATGDAKSSWNQMYGITFGDVLRTGLTADFRYSKFTSAFGSGDYKAVTISRPIADRLSLQFLAGFQNFNSTLTSTPQTHFITSYLDWTMLKSLFFEGGYTWQRGGFMSYDQYIFTIGRRF